MSYTGHTDYAPNDDRAWTYSRPPDDGSSVSVVPPPSTSTTSTYTNEQRHSGGGSRSGGNGNGNPARYGYRDLIPASMSNRDANEQPSGGGHYDSRAGSSSTGNHNAYNTTPHVATTATRSSYAADAVRPPSHAVQSLSSYPQPEYSSLARVVAMQSGRDAHSLAEQRRAFLKRGLDEWTRLEQLSAYQTQTNHQHQSTATSSSAAGMDHRQGQATANGETVISRYDSMAASTSNAHPAAGSRGLGPSAAAAPASHATANRVSQPEDNRIHYAHQTTEFRQLPPVQSTSSSGSHDSTSQDHRYVQPNQSTSSTSSAFLGNAQTRTAPTEYADLQARMRLNHIARVQNDSRPPPLVGSDNQQQPDRMTRHLQGEQGTASTDDVPRGTTQNLPQPAGTFDNATTTTTASSSRRRNPPTKSSRTRQKKSQQTSSTADANATTSFPPTTGETAHAQTTSTAVGTSMQRMSSALVPRSSSAMRFDPIVYSQELVPRRPLPIDLVSEEDARRAQEGWKSVNQASASLLASAVEGAKKDAEAKAKRLLQVAAAMRTIKAIEAAKSKSPGRRQAVAQLSAPAQQSSQRSSQQSAQQSAQQSSQQPSQQPSQRPSQQSAPQPSLPAPITETTRTSPTDQANRAAVPATTAPGGPRANKPPSNSSLRPVQYEASDYPLVLQPQAQPSSSRRLAEPDVGMMRQGSAGERDRLEATDALIALSVTTVVEPADEAVAGPAQSGNASNDQQDTREGQGAELHHSPDLPPLHELFDNQGEESHHVGDGDHEEIAEDDYEGQRRKTIAENERLLSMLGLGNNSGRSLDEVGVKRQRGRKPLPKSHRQTREPREPRQRRTRRFSPGGTTRDLPMGTERQRMACVEIIAPYSHRWLDKFEPGNLPPVPTSPKDPETVPVISRASSNSSEAEPEVRIVAKGWSLGSYENYADIPGEACHQCRRRSELPKMKCRNKDPTCGLSFCDQCVRNRYNFIFDEGDRNFICPKCEGYCNCSICLRRNGMLKNLKDFSSKDARKTGTVQSYLEAMGAEPVIPPERQIHAIRFIRKKDDWSSPSIPPNIMAKLARGRQYAKKRKNPVAGAGPPTPADKAPRKRRRTDNADGTQLDHDTGLPLEPPRKRKRKSVAQDAGQIDPTGKKHRGRPRKKLPQVAPPQEDAQEVMPTGPQKMVDSDGDTIDGMDDDQEPNPYTADALAVLDAYVRGQPLNVPYAYSQPPYPDGTRSVDARSDSNLSRRGSKSPQPAATGNADASYYSYAGYTVSGEVAYDQPSRHL